MCLLSTSLFAQCPFIVYANPKPNIPNARIWRQDLSLKCVPVFHLAIPAELMLLCRLGAFGFATNTTDLMKEMDGATSFLKTLKLPPI
jgi:hypothetical protein